MKRIHSFISSQPEQAFLLTGITLLAIYLVNLGLLPLFADEPTRAVVALEMMFSENYCVPTINGDFYYKKPPLYNWIIIAFFSATGSMSEFVFRLPSVLPLFLFVFTIYKWAKTFLSRQMAFLAAGMFVTCGRMLIYASFIGHIDIFYSWVTFLGFIALIEFGKREKWWHFFLISYALSAVAFLCKGLPTVIFQGISIISVLIALKQIKQFVSLQHLAGILLFLIPVGGYFLWYSTQNDLNGWVEFLWSQSSQRTVMENSVSDSLIHLFMFPIEQLYHLAPWSLFAIFLFRKDLKSLLWEKVELKLIVLIFLANLPIYWLSPGYYPRYLFMLYPLLFIIMAYGYEASEKEKIKKILKWLFLSIAMLFMLGSIIVYFLPSVGFEFRVWQLILVLMLALLSIFLIRGKQTSYFIGLVFLMGSFRLLFNWVVMPDRLVSGNTNVYKTEAINIAAQTLNTPLKLVKSSSINHDSSFYIERERGQILEHTFGFDKENYNLMGAAHFKYEPNCVILDSMLIRDEKRQIYLAIDPESKR